MNDRGRLYALIEKQLEQTISPDELAELDATLLTEPEARRLYLQYTDIHGTLAWNAGQDTRAVRGAGFGERGSGFRSRWLKRSWGYINRTESASLIVAALFTTAAVLLLALIAVPVYQNRDAGPKRPTFVAMLGAMSECRWGDSMDAEALRPGESLEQGQALDLVEGQAEIRFDDGASLLVEGPARLRLTADDRVELLSGRAVARVPQPAVGFVVTTPYIDVLDLGTHFGVLVEPDDSCEVLVFEGVVEVSESRAAGAPRTQRLTAHQAVRFDAPARAFTEALASAGDFRRTVTPDSVAPPTDPYGRLVMAGNPVGYWRLHGAERGIAWDLAGGNHGFLLPRGSRSAAEEQAPAPGSDELLPMAGFSFDGVAQRFDVPYRESLNPVNFTVEMWVRLRAGMDGHRSPLTARENNIHQSRVSGYLIYVDPDGRWSFWTGENQHGWPRLDGPAAAADEWTHLAVSFEATETLAGDTYRGIKRLYVNGQLAAEAEQRYTPNRSMPLRLGAGGSETAAPQYAFPGEVAEVAIYDRVLPPERILERYELGKQMVQRKVKSKPEE